MECYILTAAAKEGSAKVPAIGKAAFLSIVLRERDSFSNLLYPFISLRKSLESTIRAGVGLSCSDLSRARSAPENTIRP
jgi:hypothetical protein